MKPVQITRRPHDPLDDPPGAPRLPEILLYPGNRCNRDCHFCCVDGSPGGSFAPFALDAPERLVQLIQPGARIKLYGGEPTLHHRYFTGFIRDLRRLGYVGRLTVFSNGVQSQRLIHMLEADPPADHHRGTDAYLNHYVWHGDGVEPIPPGRRAELQAWGTANPGRLWLGHEDVLQVGGAARHTSDDVAGRPDFRGRCARCHPTMKSDGRIHACAFAVEVEAAQYDLGTIAQSPWQLRARRQRFLRWVDEVLEPAAADREEHPCVTCLRWARAETEGGTARTLPVLRPELVPAP
jgi:MoaA/NifB/PqqE/SkfB family radical SAM enzyme